MHKTKFGGRTLEVSEPSVIWSASRRQTNTDAKKACNCLFDLIRELGRKNMNTVGLNWL